MDRGLDLEAPAFAALEDDVAGEVLDPEALDAAGIVGPRHFPLMRFGREGRLAEQEQADDQGCKDA